MFIDCSRPMRMTLVSEGRRRCPRRASFPQTQRSPLELAASRSWPVLHLSHRQREVCPRSLHRRAAGCHVQERAITECGGGCDLIDDTAPRQIYEMRTTHGPIWRNRGHKADPACTYRFCSMRVEAAV
eukprot:scaffold24333_cov33-Tisochrysis_lutea.AAC.3